VTKGKECPKADMFKLQI